MARRIVSDPADRHLRDKFNLAKWVLKPEQRRKTYFEWCDKCKEHLGALTDGEEVPDDAMIAAIRLSLMCDDSFAGHVKKNDAEYLSEPEHWDSIYRVGGAVIYHEYLVAIEKGDWA